MNWTEDRFATVTQVTFAANIGAGTGANLAAQANSAIAAAFALAGSSGTVAAQFTFDGRTYLAIDDRTAVVTGQFDDATDLLIDITGATGTIAAGRFTT